MVLLGTVYEPLSHFMEGPLVVPFLVPAGVGFHGVEVEAGPLVAGEGSVVRNEIFKGKWAFEPDPVNAAKRMIEHIDKKSPGNR